MVSRSCVFVIIIKKPYVCRTGHVRISVNLTRRIKTVMSAALEWANFSTGPFRVYIYIIILYIMRKRAERRRSTETRAIK